MEKLRPYRLWWAAILVVLIANIVLFGYAWKIGELPHPWIFLREIPGALLIFVVALIVERGRRIREKQDPNGKNSNLRQ